MGGGLFNLETVILFTMVIITVLQRNTVSFLVEPVGWLIKGEDTLSKLKV